MVDIRLHTASCMKNGYDTVLMYDTVRAQVDSFLLIHISDEFFEKFKEISKPDDDENKIYQVDFKDLFPDSKNYDENTWLLFFQLLEGKKLEIDDQKIDNLIALSKFLKADKILFLLERQKPKSTRNDFSDILKKTQEGNELVTKSQILNEKYYLLSELKLKFYKIDSSSQPPDLYFDIDGDIEKIDFSNNEKYCDLAPISFCAALNNRTLVEKYLDQNNFDDSDILDALQISAIYGRNDMFDILYDTVADESAIPNNNIFVSAIIGANSNIVEKLIEEFGVDDLYREYESGRTEFHYAAMLIFPTEWENYIKIMELIKRVPEDLIVLDKQDKCPIEYLVDNFQEGEISKQKIQGLFTIPQNSNKHKRLSQQYISDYRTKTSKKLTDKLIECVKNRNQIPFKNILVFSGPVKINFSQQSPILNQIAAIPESEPFIKTYITNGSYSEQALMVNEKDKETDYNPLFAACMIENNEKNIVALIDYGCDVNKRTQVKGVDHTIFTFLATKKKYGVLRTILTHIKERNIQLNDAMKYQIIVDDSELEKIFYDEFKQFRFSKIKKINKPKDELKTNTENKDDKTNDTEGKTDTENKVNKPATETNKVNIPMSQATPEFKNPLENFNQKGKSKALENVKRPNYPINFINDKGTSPIILAAQNNLVEIVDTLLSKNCDLDHRDNNFFTAARISVNKNHPQIFNMILKKWKTPKDILDLKLLLLECCLNDQDIFIKNVYNKYKDYDGFVGLIPEQFEYNKSNTTYLHIAAQKGNKAVVKYLIDELKVNVDILNDKEETPLFSAIISRKKEVVLLLLEHHADVEKHSNDGKTPLIRAIEGHDVEITEMIIRFGANPNNGEFKGSHGIKSAFITAILNMEVKMIQLFTQRTKIDFDARYNGMKPIEHCNKLLADNKGRKDRIAKIEEIRNLFLSLNPT